MMLTWESERSDDAAGRTCMSRDGGRQNWNEARRRSSLLVVTLLGGLAWAAVAVAEDAPPPPPAPPLERLFEPVKESMKDLPPFFRDTDLKIHFRTYYFNRENTNETVNEAWAFGGWLSYRSGWLLDTFGIGGTFYGSAPLYAPDDRDGTTLLKTGQEGYYVIGEAYAALRYQDYVLVKGYRQEVTQGYINREDNRMTPNTFEGVTVGGKVGPVEYLGAYLWKMKARNSDEFVSMAEQAGAPAGNDDGVAMFGVRVMPLPGLLLEVDEQYGFNTFNTIWVLAEYTHKLSDDLKLFFGGQFTDQRAVGDQLLTNVSPQDWSTYNVSLKAAVTWKELTAYVAGQVTGDGNTAQAPWGSYPGYLSMIQEDFDRANEKAVGIGVAYDFSKLVTTGLSANGSIVWGWDAIDPKTRAQAPDQTEYDLTVDYRPPFKIPAFLQGMWLRVRGAILDQQGADTLGWQVRIILNWERDLL
jgi:outer membrane OprD family porin